jgi:hypothetical protein
VLFFLGIWQSRLGVLLQDSTEVFIHQFDPRSDWAGMAHQGWVLLSRSEELIVLPLRLLATGGFIRVNITENTRTLGRSQLYLGFTWILILVEILVTPTRGTVTRSIFPDLDLTIFSTDG